VARLEREALPLRQRLDALRAEIEVVRTELRRRERQATLAARRDVRAGLAAGQVPTLAEVLEGDGAGIELGVPLDQLRFLRESATEVRLGYSSASRQSLSLTDGRATEEVFDLGAAASLWARGWELGSPLARGVRIYPVGSRAERVVAATEIRVEGLR